MHSPHPSATGHSPGKKRSGPASHAARIVSALCLAAASVFAAPALAGAEPTASSESENTATPETVDWQGPTAGGGTIELSGERFSQVSTRGYHSVGLTSAGRVFSWGFGGNGRLGDGATENRTTPVELQRGELPDGVLISQVSAGATHTLSLGDDGSLYAWGYNGDAQLGNGDTYGRYQVAPVAVNQGQIPTDAKITQLAAGNGHNIVLADDGTMYAWGYNGGGWVGDETTHTRLTPVAVSRGEIPEDQRIVQIAAGDWHSLALTDTGDVYAWGYNSRGQLGVDSSEQFLTVPTKIGQGEIPDGVEITQISANRHTSTALGSNGKAYGWGQNDSGQLGNGSVEHAATPVEAKNGAIPDGTKLTAIDSGHTHTVALGDDGALYAWGGRNADYLLLGDGSGADSSVPVRVAAGSLPTDDAVIEVTAAERHTLVRTASGDVYAWGSGGSGWLGDGTTDARSTPVLGANIASQSVTFDETPAAALEAGADVVTVTAPAHASGIVTVSLQSEVRGGATATQPLPALTVAGRYQFGTAPAVTEQPASVRIEAGGSARFSAAADGDEPPSVRWQTSADGGTSWIDVVDATESELSVSEAAANLDGSLYRAVFTNALGEAATEAATLTVLAEEQPSTPGSPETPGDPEEPGTGSPADDTPGAGGGEPERTSGHAAEQLSRTGFETTGPLVAAGALMIAGAAVALASRRRTGTNRRA